MNSRYNLSTPEAVEVCWHRWLACSSSRRDNRRRPSPSMFPSNCVSSRLFFWFFFFVDSTFFTRPHPVGYYIKCQSNVRPAAARWDRAWLSLTLWDCPWGIPVDWGGADIYTEVLDVLLHPGASHLSGPDVSGTARFEPSRTFFLVLNYF